MAKPGRNDLCHCGSGRKYKKCCETVDRSGGARSRVLMFVVGGALLAALVAGVASFTTDTTASATRIWSAEHGHYHDATGQAIP